MANEQQESADQKAAAELAAVGVASEATIHSLAAKGDGVLVKIGQVWTYPGCEMDNSGTNLRLPVEYVPDAQIRSALYEGSLLALTSDSGGQARVVRLKPEGGPTIISVVAAGTPEAGTELPKGSRPSVDAGMRRMTNEEALEIAHRSAVTATHPPAPPGASPVQPLGTPPATNQTRRR